MKQKLFSLLLFALPLFSTGYLCSDESKVVLITGASRGVGKAAATLLADRGFKVYGTVRNRELLEDRSDENLRFVYADMTDRGSIDAAVDEVLKEEGRIDVLINNAGFAKVGPLELMNQSEIDQQMQVNFFAPVQLMQKVLPYMRKQESGHIVNITSINAVCSAPYGGFYSASKAALESVSVALSVELKEYNIDISIVEPGLLSTHFTIEMGSREIENNSYQGVIDQIREKLSERAAHPEKLHPSQTGQSVGEFICSVVEDPNPKLRYQTSDEALELVSTFLKDLDGEIYLKAVADRK